MRYGLVGGVAAELRGWPQVTLDVDLAPDPDPSNLAPPGARAQRPRRPLARHQHADGHPLTAPIDAETIAAHTSLALTCPHGPLDVVRRPDGIDGYLGAAATDPQARRHDRHGRQPPGPSCSPSRPPTGSRPPELPAIIAAFRDAGELPPA